MWLCNVHNTADQSYQSDLGLSGSVRILKNWRASIGPDTGAKSTFSVSDMVFTIAERKQREHLV